MATVRRFRSRTNKKILVRNLELTFRLTIRDENLMRLLGKMDNASQKQVFKNFDFDKWKPELDANALRWFGDQAREHKISPLLTVIKQVCNERPTLVSAAWGDDVPKEFAIAR